MTAVAGVGDYEMVALVSIAIAIVNVLVMIGISVVHAREPGPPLWALASMIFAAGVTIMALRNPQNETAVIIAGNSAFVLMYAVYWWGLLGFLHRRPPLLLTAVLFLLYLLPFTWFTVADPDATARVVVVCLAMAVIIACMVWSLMRSLEPGLLQSQMFVALVFSIAAVLYLLRAIAGLIGMIGEADFQRSPLGTGIFLIPAIGSLLATFGCGMMLTQRLQQRMQFNTRTDTLTGLVSRALLDDLGIKEVARSRRHGYPLSVVIFDIDHFDSVNREHGHRSGDVAMRQLAAMIVAQLRREDCFARQDGASFCILLPSTRLAGAENLAERLRSQVAATSLAVNGSALILTASFGIATLGLHGEDWATLVQRAQGALNRAKAEGRNRIATAPLVGAALGPA